MTKSERLRNTDNPSPSGIALQNVVFAIFIFSVAMASVIAWRIPGGAELKGFALILAWQIGVWVPWMAYWLAIKYLSNRVHTSNATAVCASSLHVIAALFVAISHLGWYWQISSNFSPLLGMPITRFGVYPFFFIFWFVIDLLFYWSITVVLQNEARPDHQQNSGIFTEHFAVHKGRTKHIVRTADINWVEAQGYYAGLHTDAGCFLIRKSLGALANELDPTRFVRVHRSTIVGIAQIREIQSAENGVTTVTLKHGGSRNVSREGRRRLKDLLQPQS
jgi:hypothetical protein